MKVLSWNIRAQGLADRLPRLIAAIDDEKPDIVLLQEVGTSMLDAVRAQLAAIGLTHSVDSLADSPRDLEKRPLPTLIASKWPTVRSDDAWRAKAPYPDAMVRATVLPPEAAAIDVFNVHIPNGSNHGWRKIETLDVLYAALVLATDEPRILCGDFNEPKVFRRSGQIVTFGDEDLVDGAKPWKDRFGTERPCRDWTRGVLQVLAGATSHGLRNVHRTMHGFAHVPITHVTKASPRWFDHGFASRHFELTSAKYRHDWRETGLSDHSALVFEATCRSDVGPLMEWTDANAREEAVAEDE